MAPLPSGRWWYNVEGATRRRLATSSIVISGSDSIALAAARSLATKAEGRPPFLPQARAASSPSFVRSRMRAFQLRQGTEHMKYQFLSPKTGPVLTGELSGCRYFPALLRPIARFARGFPQPGYAFRSRSIFMLATVPTLAVGNSIIIVNFRSSDSLRQTTAGMLSTERKPGHTKAECDGHKFETQRHGLNRGSNLSCFKPGPVQAVRPAHFPNREATVCMSMPMLFFR